MLLLGATALPASTPTVVVWVAIIISLLGGGAGLAALLRLNSQKRIDDAAAVKTTAEAGKTEAETAQVEITAVQIEEETRKNFLEMIREGTADLRQQLNDERAENATLRQKVAELELEIEKLERRLDADHMNREMQSLRLKLEASERDRLWWRNRAETLQLMVDGEHFEVDRRDPSHDTPPDLDVDRRVPPSERDGAHFPSVGDGLIPDGAGSVPPGDLGENGEPG